MADEKSIEKIPEHQHTQDKAAEPEPIAEDLSDSEAEDVSGGGPVYGDNDICGFGC